MPTTQAASAGQLAEVVPAGLQRNQAQGGGSASALRAVRASGNPVLTQLVINGRKAHGCSPYRYGWDQSYPQLWTTLR